MSVFVSAMHASSVGADCVVPVLDYLIGAIRANEDFLRRLSTFALDWQPYTDFVGIAGFLLVTRRELWNAPKVYELVFSERPLKAWRAGGVRDEHIEYVRRSLFFYILFLFYLFVQFPLTLGPSNIVEVGFDLAVQFMLLVSVLWRVSVVKSSLNVRHKDDEEKQETVGAWLDKQLREMGIPFAGLRRRVIVLFLLSFSLVFAQNPLLLAKVLLSVLEGLKAVFL